MPYLELLGSVCYGSKDGLATVVVSDQFFKNIRDHGGSKKDVQPFSLVPFR